jgi:hypothetical protein
VVGHVPNRACGEVCGEPSHMGAMREYPGKFGVSLSEGILIRPWPSKEDVVPPDRPLCIPWNLINYLDVHSLTYWKRDVTT